MDPPLLTVVMRVTMLVDLRCMGIHLRVIMDANLLWDAFGMM